MFSTYNTPNVFGENSNLTNFFHSKVLANHDRVYHDAVDVNYFLTDVEFSFLQKIFAPRYIRYSNLCYDYDRRCNIERPLKTSPHPIASFLTKFAYDRCCNQVRLYTKKNFNSMEIGSNFSNVSNLKFHRCTYVNCSRDSARMVNTSMREDVSHDLLHLALDKQDHHVNKTICNIGAQNCHYKSSYAFSVNVNYDISMQDIAEIFSNHGLLVYDVWMFLPDCLLDESLVNDQVYYKCKIINKEKISKSGRFFQKATVIFSLNDLSNCYSHDFSTWRAYYTTTLIHANGFSIVSEIIENYGNFCHIRFTRSSFSKDNIIRCIPLTHQSRYKDFVIIPNVIKSLNEISMFTCLQKYNFYKYYYMLPSNFVTSCIEYGTRQFDARFDYNNFATWANSASTNIIYSGGVIQSGFRSDPNSMDDIIQNLFILTAVMRLRRTQQISQAFYRIKKDDVNFHIFGKLKDFIEDICQVIGSFFGKRKDKYEFEKSDGFVFSITKHISKIRALTIPDMYCSDVIYSKSINSGYSYVSDLDFKHFEYIHDIEDDKIDKTVGNCGWHSLYPSITTDEITGRVAIFLKNFNDLSPFVLNISNYEEFAINKDYKSGQWLHINDLALLCYIDKFNLHLHGDSGDVDFEFDFDFKFEQWKSVHYSGNHFSVATCLCYPSHIIEVKPVKEEKKNVTFDVPFTPVGLITFSKGEYKIIDKLSPGETSKYLYINAANEALGDGAGQAAAFRNCFPNYHLQINNNTLNTHDFDKPIILKHLINNCNYHLAICVALNNVNGNTYNNKQCYTRLSNIFRELNNYCIINKITPVLPLLGCNLFRNPLTCFVTALSEFTIPIIINSFTNTELENVRKLCERIKHGNTILTDLQGFGGDECVILDVNCQVSLTNVIFHPMEWDSISDHKAIENRALSKVKELFGYIQEKPLNFTEISFAPGFMLNHIQSNFNINCSGYHYNGPDSLKINDDLHKNITIVNYNNIDTLNIDPCHFLLIDIGPCEAYVKHYKSYIRLASFADNIIIKCFLVDNNGDNFVFTELLNHFSCLFNVKCLRLKTSRKRSSEIYLYMIRRKINSTLPIRIVDDVFNNLYVDISTKSPKPVIHPNPIVNFKPHHCIIKDKGEFTRFNNFLVNSASVIGVDAAKIHNDAFNIMSIDVNCLINVSVGGSGKTTTIRRSMIKYTRESKILPDCIVSPIRNIYTDNVNEFTFHMFLVNLINGRIFRNIYIDECFRFTNSYISFINFLSPTSTIHLLGDHNQITGVDPSGVFNSADYVTYNGEYDISTTLRMPVDAAHYCSNLINKTITSASNVITSVFTKIIQQDFDYSKIPRFQCITHTNDICTELNKLGHNCRTIDTSQGNTYPLLNLILSQRDMDDMGNNRMHYIYTALSRHTRCLVIYAPSQAISQILTIKGNNIDMTLALNGTAVVNEILLPPQKQVTLPPPQVEVFDSIRPTIDGVEKIISQYITPTKINLSSNTLGIHVPMLAKPSTNRVVIPLSAVDCRSINVNGHRIANTSYCMYSFSKDKLFSMQSQIARYTKATPKHHYHLLDGFLNFSKYSRSEIKKLFTPTLDDMLYHTKEYLIQLQKKFPDKYSELFDFYDQNNVEYKMNIEDVDDKLIKDVYGKIFKNNFSKDTEQKMEEICEFFPFSKNNIQFFMKRQAKYTTTNDFDVKFKAGQGVSAWSKIYNIFFSAFARYFNHILPQLVKKNVLYATGLSEAKLANFFRQFSEEIASDLLHVSTDFTEFDTSHGPDSLNAEEELYNLFSINPYIIKCYIDARRKWKQINRLGDFCVFNQGTGYQHSGQPLTLISNTYFNMCVIGLVYSFTNLIYACFKGDDFEALCRKCTKIKSNDTRTILERMGYQIKIKTGTVSEFISYIITPCGLFPDLIRRVARIISTIFITHEDWLETRRNLNDCLAVIMDAISLQVGLEYSVLFYRTIGIEISKESLYYLYRFLQNISTMEIYLTQTPGVAKEYSTYILNVD